MFFVCLKPFEATDCTAMTQVSVDNSRADCKMKFLQSEVNYKLANGSL